MGMILTLTPQRGRAETTLHVAGDVLTVDGVAFDLSAVPEGGAAEAEGTHPFRAPIRRLAGVIHATLLVKLGHTADPSQPASPWTITAGDGPVTIPALRLTPPEVTE